MSNDDYFSSGGNRKSKNDKKAKRKYTKYKKGGPRRALESQHNVFKD